MTSIKPRNQRKEFYNAPLHKKRKWISLHLEENLLLKYDRRSIPVVKGDTVRVMRGSFRGHENKIAHVNLKKGYLEIEGITMIKADGKKIAKPIHPSNVMITKLNLTDKWRRRKLEKGLTDETKKEIEKEAEEQIEEMEKEELLRRKAEEESEEPSKEEPSEKLEVEKLEPAEEKNKKPSPSEKTEKIKTEEKTKKPKEKEEKTKEEKNKTTSAKKTPAKPKKKEENKK